VTFDQTARAAVEVCPVTIVATADRREGAAGTLRTPAVLYDTHDDLIREGDS